MISTGTRTDWPAVARSVGLDLRPTVPDHDRTGQISREAFDRFRETGITSALVPSDVGGGGASHAQMGAVLRELGRHDPASAVTLSMHAHVLAAQVWRHHHGMDAEAILRKVAAERLVFVSTGASDWLASSGSAQRVEGGYRVSARKGPASGCEVGDVLATTIRWADAPDGPHVIHCAVPCSAPGVSIAHTWDALGMRATGSHTVVLDDVFVPDAAVSLVRPAGVWHPIWNVVIGAALPLIVSAYLGAADAALDAALLAAAGRTEDHIPMAVGEMVNAHTVAEDVTVAMFAAADDLHFPNTDGIAARMLARKTVATEAIVATTRLALEVAGGSGYGRGGDIERLLRDVHGCLFHPLPRARQLPFTGRVVLGRSPVGPT